MNSFKNIFKYILLKDVFNIKIYFEYIKMS